MPEIVGEIAPCRLLTFMLVHAHAGDTNGTQEGIHGSPPTFIATRNSDRSA